MAYTETALTTVKTVRDWCKIVDAGDQPIVAGGDNLDDILLALISRGSQYLISMMNRQVLFAKDLTEIRNGNGRNVLFATVTPINAITSVSINGSIVPQRSSTLGSGFTFDSDLIYLTSDYCFYDGLRNVEIVWNCGIAQDHPYVAILEQGLLEMINFKWQRRKHADVVSEKSGGFITAQFSAVPIPVETQIVIDKLSMHVPIE